MSASGGGVAGFHAINVKSNTKYGSSNILYYKRHEVRDEDKKRPADKTIFVANVPPLCTESSLKNVFSKCGSIRDVFIMNQPGPSEQDKNSPLNVISSQRTGSKVAYVVFKSPASVDKALKLDHSKVYFLSTDEKPLTGLRKWCKNYGSRYPNPQKLQKEVDFFMENFDKEREKVQLEEASSAGLADEEGWVTVGRKGRKAGLSRMDATQIEEKRRNKKKKAFLHFYNFQQRESRREHIATLRKKFEEDKLKIQQMKAQRKFRPY